MEDTEHLSGEHLSGGTAPLGNQTNLSTRDAFVQERLALIRTAYPFFSYS